MTDVALLAAQLDEVAPLLRRLGARRSGRDAGASYWSGEWRGAAVSIAVGGMGRRRAAAAAGSLLARSGARCLLVAGVAGALTPDIDRGALAVAVTVSNEDGDRFELDGPAVRAASGLGARTVSILTVDRMISTPAERAALLATATAGAGPPSRPTLVDMESWDAVAEAVRRGVPATVLRAVSDGSGDALPGFLARCRRPDGDLDRRRAVLGALLRPSSIPVLYELGRRVRGCAEALAEVVPELLVVLARRSPPPPSV